MTRIALFFRSTVLMLIAIPLFWVASLGRYERAEHWLSDVYFAKEHRASEIDKPKLLVIAGSNALFGFDSYTLESLMGRPVVNLAGHAALPLNFHIQMALKYAKPDDIVLMPLEFAYYASTPSPTSWDIANFSSWGARYVDWTLQRMLEYFRHSDFTSLLSRILVRRIPSDPQGKVLATVEANSAHEIAVWHGYSYSSMNARGDILIDMDTTSLWPIVESGYTNGSVTTYAIERLTWLQNQLKSRGAALKLTWPVTMRSPQFDLREEKYRSIIEELRGKLEAAGLDVICDAAAFQFNRSLFFDNSYHMNAEGAERRMEALAACMQQRSIDHNASRKTLEERRQQAAIP
jgi:hypothetical protein